MAKIVWLASYPKSGNTWVRALLANYLAHGDTPAAINRLDIGTNAAARLWFDEWAGIEATALPERIVTRLRPHICRRVAGEARDTLYLKVHDAWAMTDQGEALFPPDVTAATIYVVRNPLDLAASFAAHWGIGIAEAVESLCDPEYAIARGTGGPIDQLRQTVRSWSLHVRSWLDESGLHPHAVRYEDLQHDPKAALAGIARHCGLGIDEAKLERAAVFSTFAELQRQEKETNFRERSPRAKEPFFRHGRTGGWREELSPEQVDRLIAAHGPTMQRFSYLDSASRPV